MTWRAPRGETVLASKEREVFGQAILDIAEQIIEASSDEESVIFDGATLFNQMARTQQSAALEAVAEALFFDTSKCFELTAWSEATLATILAAIRAFVTLELDDEAGGDDVRRLVNEKVGGMISADSEGWQSHDQWSSVMDLYEEQFLWDLDFENEKILDLPPEQARALKMAMGVGDGYHTAIPPDLDYESELDAVYHRIWLLTMGKKKVTFTVTMEANVPASFAIQDDEDWGQTLNGLYPTVIMMKANGPSGKQLDHGRIQSI